ncbi:MAG: vitamin K epoxide reductase family protein [bacterium]|nr:vitamin K epoxide reductase family protein [bacterium]
MTPFKLSFSRLSNPPRWILIAFLVLSFLGFLDASYLVAEHYLGIPLICTITHGCGEVLKSEFSSFFGIPIALFGALYYAAIFFLTILFLDTRNSLFLKWALLLPLGGFLFSLWLIFVQAFLVEAWCQYCLLSAFLSTLLFLLSLVVFLQPRGKGVQ